MTSSPSFQFAGVATRCLAVSCSESMTRSTSSKFRPVVIGYTRTSLIFLSGPITNTFRTVWLSAGDTGPLRQPSRGRTSEGGDVGLLGADRLGGGAQGGQFGLGQVALDDPADAGRADLGLHAQVDAGDAVLAVHPGADRHDRTGVL